MCCAVVLLLCGINLRKLLKKILRSLHLRIVLVLDRIPSCPLIYFQVISRDSWERYRSEGLSYKFIPIFEPTTYEFTAQCIRICPKFPAGELRRYFIGDYFNIDDISWVGLPKEHQVRIIFFFIKDYSTFYYVLNHVFKLKITS